MSTYYEMASLGIISKDSCELLTWVQKNYTSEVHSQAVDRLRRYIIQNVNYKWTLNYNQRT